MVMLLATVARTEVGSLDGVVVLVDPPDDHSSERFHGMPLRFSTRSDPHTCANGEGVEPRRAEIFHAAGAGGGGGGGETGVNEGVK